MNTHSVGNRCSEDTGQMHGAGPVQITYHVIYHTYLLNEQPHSLLNIKKTATRKIHHFSALILFALSLLLTPGMIKAQYMTKGRYVDTTNSAIPYANVLLLGGQDSALVKGEITDEAGNFSLVTNTSGRFIIAVKYVGYEDYYSKEFILDDANPTFEMGSIIAVEKPQQLDDVVIEAKKPLFEQKIDRTIINVESSITASGGSVLDVLERSPGVVVDRLNMAVTMAGKEGVRIMINGKVSQIPLEATVQMLAGMNAESVEKIELITTPPSKYEAAGDAGLINIILKQQTDTGTNGNLSVFAGYGRKEKYGGNISVNNRSRQVNLYGDYSYNNDVTEQLFGTDRVVNTGSGQVSIDNDNNRDAFTRIHSGRLGADWHIGEETTVGGILSIFDRRWEMDALATIRESVNTNPPRNIEMETFEINTWTLWVGNINLMHAFKNGHSLSVDMDYIGYNADNPTDYMQRFYGESKGSTATEELSSRKKTPIETWVGAMDYTKEGDKLTFEAGIKASFSSLKNDIIVENIENGSSAIDESLTSHAKMNENIGAAYTSATFDPSEEISLKFGLRYEHTVTEINTREEGNVVHRNFGSLFPSFFFQHKINEGNSWVLSYSRRITRPSFFQIAPFVLFTDPNTFLAGNISLLPAMTDAVKAEYSYKSLLFSLQYSHDKNSISLFQPRITEDGKQVSMAENMDYRNNYSINISLPFNIVNWWEWQLNLSGNLIQVKTDYLAQPVDITIKNFTLNGTQKFLLPNQFTAEISGFYQSKQLFGVMEMKAFGGVDFGLEKKFQNSQLSLAVTDIFNTSKFDFKATIPEENLDTGMLIDVETRVIRVTYSTSFGNGKLNIKKRDTTGSEEEQQRFR